MLKKTLLFIATVLICVDTAFANTDERRIDGFWGFWVLEKTEVYGVEPDDPKLAEFYKRFDGMAFEAEIVTEIFYQGMSVEAEGGTIYFNNGCGYYPKKQVLPLSEVFTESTFGKDGEASFKMWFKETFGVELNNTVTVWNLTNCEPLGMSVLVLPEKLVLMAEGKIYGAFKKVGFKEYLAASGLDSSECFSYDIGMGWVEQCWYENKTLAEVYTLLREIEPTKTKPLKETLPTANTNYNSHLEDEDIYVSYEYISADHLMIEVGYGNDIIIEIRKHDNLTLLRIWYSMD